MNIIVKQIKKDGIINNINENDISIKAMSFNMKRNYFSFGKNSWDKRAELIQQTIKKQMPDIVGTQELTEKSLKDIQRLLPEYSFIGQGRGGMNKGEYTAIFYLRDKFILKDEKTFWLSKTPNKPSRSWFTLFPRICTTCTLALHSNQQELIRIYNTHLDHLSWISRKKSLNLISNKIEEKNDERKAKVLLMGDFNTTSSSRTLKRWYNELTEKNNIRLDNTYYQLRVKDMGRSYHGFKGKIDGAPIDFIFVSHDLNIQKVQICRDNLNKRYPSDHYPIFVQLAFST